jgi:hypothetical protein
MLPPRQVILCSNKSHLLAIFGACVCHDLTSLARSLALTHSLATFVLNSILKWLLRLLLLLLLVLVVYPNAFHHFAIFISELAESVHAASLDLSLI